MSDRPLWHVVEDPAFAVTLSAYIIITLMLVGLLAIYVITHSIIDSVIASVPPIFIALIMILAKRTIKRNEVAIYVDRVMVIRGSERVELPIYRLTRIRTRPVINTVKLRGVKIIPNIPRLNIPRFNTWSVTFLSGDEELVNVWINETELEKLRGVIRKLCIERGLCINIEGILLSR